MSTDSGLESVDSSQCLQIQVDVYRRRAEVCRSRALSADVGPESVDPERCPPIEKDVPPPPRGGRGLRPASARSLSSPSARRRGGGGCAGGGRRGILSKRRSAGRGRGGRRR